MGEVCMDGEGLCSRDCTGCNPCFRGCTSILRARRVLALQLLQVALHLAEVLHQLALPFLDVGAATAAAATITDTVTSRRC